jgi:hypothetical protein
MTVMDRRIFPDASVVDAHKAPLQRILGLEFRSHPRKLRTRRHPPNSNALRALTATAGHAPRLLMPPRGHRVNHSRTFTLAAKRTTPLGRCAERSRAVKGIAD